MVREMEEEEEEEEVSLSHFIHDHPLTLIEISNKGINCHGCGGLFTGEAAYGCKKCGNEKILHEQCGEMPREIRHPLHPQHTMVQEKGNDTSKSCAVCEVTVGTIGYFCTSPGCEFQLHMACTPAMGVEKVGDEPTRIKHPSHPQHQLFLMRKRHTFKCDACGSMETGRSYGSLPCEYWIHERCATLPTTSDYHHYPDHPPLLLAFNLPPAHSKFSSRCGVCRKKMPIFNRWVYHCQMCRYIVHIKCPIKVPQLPETSSDNADAVDAEGAIQFPCSQFHEEVIKPFVIREMGEMMMPRDDQKYMFPTHPHQLSFVSLSISEVKDDEDDDDDLDSCRQISELICDACTTPISSSSSSSSSSLGYNKYYMSCGECKYFLHLACFNLPPKLSPHPLHKTDHTLILQACPKLDFHMKCSICDLPMNGVIYSCTECSFKADIKCASLPNTIKHGSHPQHHLHSKFWAEEEYIEDVWRGYCSGCNYIKTWGMLYECGSCDFTLCSDCVMLPPVNKHECDRHPVPLRYDAYLDHSGDFYCDACEREMNPNQWMYYCRSCDTSFHPGCFPATSGEFRNMKFGQQYNVPHALHPHPLTFQILATKLRCDVCGLRVYGEANVDQRGFHCSSCNFFMCLDQCGWWVLDAID